MFARDHEDICGLHVGEVDICRAEPPYPSFVHINIEEGSVLSDDARAYALLLLAAAEAADAETDRAFIAAGYTLAGDGAEGGATPKGTALSIPPPVESGAVSGESQNEVQPERRAHA